MGKDWLKSEEYGLWKSKVIDLASSDTPVLYSEGEYILDCSELEELVLEFNEKTGETLHCIKIGKSFLFQILPKSISANLKLGIS